jgi:hypothetical protein
VLQQAPEAGSLVRIETLDQRLRGRGWHHARCPPVIGVLTTRDETLLRQAVHQTRDGRESNAQLATDLARRERPGAHQQEHDLQLLDRQVDLQPGARPFAFEQLGDVQLQVRDAVHQLRPIRALAHRPIPSRVTRRRGRTALPCRR